MSDDPISGREPSLGGQPADLTGDEPFIGGEGSLAALLAGLDDASSVPSDVLVNRLAGVIPQLIPYLDGEDARLRRTAARMMGLIAASHPASRDQTMPLLIRVLDRAFANGDRVLTEMAIARLGDTQDIRAVTRLLEIRDRFVIEDHRQTIRDALIRLGPVAVPPMLAYADRGSYFFSHLFHYCLTPALTHICRDHPEVHPVVAQWLMPFLLDERQYNFAYVAFLIPIVSAELAGVIAPMTEIIRDTSEDLARRHQMLARIRHIQDLRVSALLLDLLMSDERMFYREARRGLSALRFREDIPRILAMIEDPAPRIAREGLRLAGLRHLRAALPTVTLALKDPKQIIRRDAMVAIRRIRDANSVDLLLPMLEDRAGPVRARAVRELGILLRHFPERRAETEAAVRAAIEREPEGDIKTRLRAELITLVYRLR